ncbi:sensor histidine kinase [Streptomyces sp. NBC_00264]|uniref:sensor histidine kinase n=1 Tax=unclassified Streptomyces TaxID=2593676 RepID=UPI0022564DA0|nr:MULTISPECIES: sensor histidine kinase [unclassified Streptomyces]MCX5165843.1 sensor histidine kinase [Streptomyces sp. NBC_00305]MCX5224024.1 sensor histidine kinase [Streptomyces sp. NBC_00264]WSG56421.1 sensor histidine kinase [Streptomyces sp. NBC_01732]WSX07585.1 sensor histidine kinase [Streptomyces sp. NBC_00987]
MRAGTEVDPDDDHPILARRLSRRQHIALDCAFVFVYAAALLLTGSTAAPYSAAAVPWELPVLIAAATAPVAVRRIWPLPVFVLVLMVTVVAVVRDATWDPFLSAAYAMYTVALTLPSHRWWQRWLPGLALAALALAGAAGATHAGDAYWWRGGPGLLLLGLTALLASWQLGRAARQRRAFAVRAAQQLAQRAVAEERLRVARELHDVVTHSMGLIAVKAGVANHVLHVRPQEAHDALQIIERTSRTALNDMRRMLGVLRTSEGERQPVSLGPVPGAVALPELVGQAGAQLTVRGVENLPDGVALAVYRIVQEALTNVAKHAGPEPHCRVVVGANGHEVRIDITDDGDGRAPRARTTGGHGIVGMRERVAMYGGTLTAGPRPEGGFAVHASLPYEESP